MCPQSERQLPPTDISSGPLQPPTQPKIHFQLIPLGKANHTRLTVNGIAASVGLNTQFRKMQHIATHANISL